ncbi:hypothetical protein HJG60_010426 [Phyllostomus discolor]|uniref:Uncharacterized protein n=1 Tax=Phyllostomus discolor TaxID=89673 RepID=A0A834ARU5_9CHIR|nr:hypothetical protein HJG60_010426 [Phyllostomus discolor]
MGPVSTRAGDRWFRCFLRRCVKGFKDKVSHGLSHCTVPSPEREGMGGREGPGVFACGVAAPVGPPCQAPPWWPRGTLTVPKPAPSGPSRASTTETGGPFAPGHGSHRAEVSGSLPERSQSLSQEHTPSLAPRNWPLIGGRRPGRWK